MHWDDFLDLWQYDRLVKNEDGTYMMAAMYGHHNERIMTLDEYWEYRNES